MKNIFELKGIVKTFPGVIANDHIDFSADGGEIRALVGENGAGKSTLMNILYGLYQPDEGQIYVRGNMVHLHSPLDAIQAGLGMIHQEFKLFPTFKVYENVVFGSEINKKGFLDNRTAIESVKKLSEQYGMSVDPLARVGDLPVGVRQRVEILKMLYREAEILILDEPTAVLTPQECDSLFEVLKNLANQGKTIVFITHKLEEVLAISDNLTVLRGGKIMGTLKTSKTDVGEICKLMVGVDISFGVEKSDPVLGGDVLVVENLTVSDEGKRNTVDDVSFKISAGEIVGIAGVAGNGQAELVEAISGQRLIKKGTIQLTGTDISHESVRERRKKGLAFIPEDRQNVGLALKSTVAENLIMGFQYKKEISHKGLLKKKDIKSFSKDLINKYSIKVSDPSELSTNLSGGNQQKLVVAREMHHQADLLICEQPTRGIDVKSTQFVHESLVKYRDEGKAVLLSSTELSEIMTLSDRILVMFKGKIVGEFEGKKVTDHELGLYMTGMKSKNEK